MYTYTVLYQLTDQEENNINSFLLQCTGFYYFQSPAFFYVCNNSKKIKPVYIIAYAKEKMVGVLLYYRQLQIDILLLRFFTSRNVVIAGPAVKGNNGDICQYLLTIYQGKSIKSLYTQIRNLDDTSAHKLVFEKKGFTYEDHLNIIVDLSQTEEVLWKDIHTKRRNEIRRAEKEGCRFNVQTSLDSLLTCYDILKEVYQRARLPLPNFGHFKTLLDQADETTGLRLFTVVWEGKIIGCMMCLAYGNTLYDYYAGAYSRFYHKYPNDLLPWEVFKWAKKKGFTRFDFGGAGKPGIPYGVRDYKRKFGGDLVNYGRYESSAYPTMYKIAAWVFRIYKNLKITSLKAN